MALAYTIAPVRPRRAFLLFVLAAAMAYAGRPPSTSSELAQVGLPDAKEAARLLEQFRGAGIPGDYYFAFELQHMPRRGDTRVYKGQLWGSRNDGGAITRVQLADADGRTHRLLIQNGEKPAVWRLRDGKVTPVDARELFAPLIPGIEITAFDLQMPYLYWPDAKVQAIKRVLGRPANAFLFQAPADIAEKGRISAVRAYLDTQYNALTQTELLGPSGRVMKTFSLVSLKTVERQTLPRTVDFRNEETRDKTRLHLTAVALQLDLGPAPFTPAALAEDIRPPRRIVNLD